MNIKGSFYNPIDNSFKISCAPRIDDFELPFYISTIGRTANEQGTSWTNSKHILVYSENGCGKALINEKWEPVPKGSIIYIPANVPVEYKSASAEPWDNLYISFLGKYSESFLGLNACIIKGDLKFFADTVYKFKERQQESDFTEYSISKLYYILLRLKSITLNHTDKNIVQSDAKDNVELSVKYVTEHYTSDLTLPFLASNCGISEEYYCRMFKKITGATPVTYMNILRVNRACDLLTKHPDKQIEEIAHECGYASAAYFNRVFKKNTGTTPTKFRNNK